MKLSELRGCDCCGGTILGVGQPTCYVIRVTQAMLNRNAVNQVMGLTQMLGGSLGLAEVFASEDSPVTVFGDEKPELMTELLICTNCVLMNTLDIAAALENRRAVEKRAEGKS